MGTAKINNKQICKQLPPHTSRSQTLLCGDNFLSKEADTRKLIKDYEPYMRWTEILLQMPYAEQINREVRFLEDSLDEVRSAFLEKILTIWEIPEDTTVELGVENGFCNDWWAFKVFDFWEGTINENQFIYFMRSTPNNE